MSQKDPNSRTIHSEAKLITLAVLGYHIIHRLLKIFNGRIKMILHLKVRSIKKTYNNHVSIHCFGCKSRTAKRKHYEVIAQNFSVSSHDLNESKNLVSLHDAGSSAFNSKGIRNRGFIRCLNQ